MAIFNPETGELVPKIGSGNGGGNDGNCAGIGCAILVVLLLLGLVMIFLMKGCSGHTNGPNPQPETQRTASIRPSSTPPIQSSPRSQPTPLGNTFFDLQSSAPLTFSQKAQPVATPGPSNSLPVRGFRVIGVRPNDYLKIRLGPGTSYQPLMGLRNGVGGILIVGGPVQNGETTWIKVRFQGVEGWANADFLSPE